MAAERARTSKTRGVNDRLLRSLPKLTHRDLDPQGLLTEVVVREFIASATCPYCGAGPFTTLSGHTNRAHGIDRHELRGAAGLSGNQPISSPEYRRKCQERGREKGFGVSTDPSEAGRKARANGQGTQTAAGIKRQRENIANVTASMTADDYKLARSKAWQTLIATGRAEEKVKSLHAAKRKRRGRNE